jgi:urease accessory protein
MRAELDIQVAATEGITRLKQSYFTPPLKIANITEYRNDPFLRLMLMSSSPGILDGDEYDMQITLERSAALHITTQSYQRLFTMQKGASQQLTVRLEEGASLAYLPMPVVPHKASIFAARNTIHLHPQSSLIWGEVFTCGRKLNGELFVFSKYHNITEIFMEGKLLIRDNIFLQPELIDVTAIGQSEGYSHQASMVYLHPAADIKALTEWIAASMDKESALLFGITAAPVNGLILRMLAQKAEQLQRCMQSIAAYLPLLHSQKAAVYVA